MHKFMTATAILALLCAGPAFAQTTTATSDSSSTAAAVSGSISQGGNSTSGASANTGPSSASATTGASTATANPNANNAGNAQAITFNTTNPDAVRTVPQVYAPALTTTLTETCMGSTSGGASWLGGGLSLGTSWRDDECVRRLTARELSQTLGDREAARAIMCGNKAVLDAYDRLGRPCPQSPLYKVSEAGQYMPQLPVAAAPLPPAPPVIVNVPAPAPTPAQVMMMAPVPNPPRTAPVRHRHAAPACAAPTGGACHR